MVNETVSINSILWAREFRLGIWTKNCLLRHDQTLHIFPSAWIEWEERCGLVMVSLTPWATRGQHLVYISFSHQSCRSFHTQTQKHTQVLYCNSITSQSWQKVFSIYVAVIKKNAVKRNYFAYSFKMKPQHKKKLPCVMSNFLPKH